MSALAYALIGFGVGFVLVVAGLMRAASRASRAEERRDLEREGGEPQ